MDRELVKLLAKYNVHVNTEMNKIISTLSQAEWKKELGGFYKSIHALCSHLYIGDQNWLNRFSALKSLSILKIPFLIKFTYGMRFLF